MNEIAKAEMNAYYRERNKNLTDEQKEKKREKARKYYATHKKLVQEIQKKWRDKNKDKVAAIQERYWLKRAAERSREKVAE